jgi:hypothetical protein
MYLKTPQLNQWPTSVIHNYMDLIPAQYRLSSKTPPKRTRKASKIQLDMVCI